MSNRTISDTTKTLLKAREIIKDKKNWGQYSRKRATTTGYYQYCALGAIDAAIGDGGDFRKFCLTGKHISLLSAAIPGKKFDGLRHPDKNAYGDMPNWRVAVYNNLTDHEAVLKMFDDAIQLSLREDANV